MLDIEIDAATILLKVLLSCQCPITEKAEKEITDYIKTQRNKPTIDFSKFIESTGGSNSDTVFQRLRDCCYYYRNNLTEVLITKEDVYRHFCSAYHWKIAEDSLHAIPQKANTPVTDLNSWFIGHMLLPVKLLEENGSVRAEYSGTGFRISLTNIFVPSDVKVRSGAFYSMHFASAISEISNAESGLINQQLESIDQFIEFRKKVKAIDYSSFQRFGNYKKICENRYNKYFA